jgi:uncharacterized circularly permuted ATP-grasp superfamily protein
MTGETPHFDEMLRADGSVREPYDEFCAWYSSQDAARLRTKARDAENFFRRTGITFAVYGEEEASERLIPFDIVPRIISGREWARLSRGIEQRVRAINAFLYDIYHRQEILRAGRVPVELIAKNDAYLPQMIGMDPPGGIYTHIIGVDIVRTGPNQFYVLEDNARTPSGVSYMLENRETMLHMFPELFRKNKVREVSDYPRKLRRSLAASAPRACNGAPEIAVLTPGIHNSAYFEHSFLADQMGAELVEGHDLRVIDGRVAMRTTQGYRAIDVLYRRVDDDYLDPLTFRPESALGVPGIMDVYRAGGITIANAPGTGISDDKAIYSYMPEIVEFYTGKGDPGKCADLALLRTGFTRLCDGASARTGGQGSPRIGRLWHAGRTRRQSQGTRSFPRQAQGAAGQLHRAAHACAVHGADHDPPGAGAAACRSAPVCAGLAQRHRHHARRPHPCGAEKGLFGGQFQPGRGHQGQLGAGRMMRAVDAEGAR